MPSDAELARRWRVAWLTSLFGFASPSFQAVWVIRLS